MKAPFISQGLERAPSALAAFLQALLCHLLMVPGMWVAEVGNLPPRFSMF